MAIGSGWADGAWIDASWVVGAWEQSSLPLLTNASVTNITTIAAKLLVTTNIDNNILYRIVDQSPTKPSVAQIQLGKGSDGLSADAAANAIISFAGEQNVTTTLLTENTTYYFYAQLIDDLGNDSAVTDGIEFTTESEVRFIGTPVAAGSYNWIGQVGIVHAGLEVISSAVTGYEWTTFAGSIAAGTELVSEASPYEWTGYSGSMIKGFAPLLPDTYTVYELNGLLGIVDTGLYWIEKCSEVNAWPLASTDSDNWVSVNRHSDTWVEEELDSLGTLECNE